MSWVSRLRRRKGYREPAIVIATRSVSTAVRNVCTSLPAAQHVSGLALRHACGGHGACRTQTSTRCGGPQEAPDHSAMADELAAPHTQDGVAQLLERASI